MRNVKRTSLFILLYMLLCSQAWGVIYKWVDEKGVTHYSDDPRDVPAEHETLEQLAPVHTIQAPDKALTRIQEAAQRERRQPKRVQRAQSRSTASSHSSCEAYRRQLGAVQAKLRRGYREPRGNKLRERRRELSALIKQTCY
jgi:hypothetical protein